MIIPVLITVAAWALALCWPRTKRNSANGVALGLAALAEGAGQLLRIGIAIIVTLLTWLIYFIFN